MSFTMHIENDDYDEVTLATERLLSLFRLVMRDEAEGLEKSGELSMFLHILWNDVILIDKIMSEKVKAPSRLKEAA